MTQFNETVQEFDKWLAQEQDTNVNELMVEGAKDYISGTSYHRNDYVTKKEVRELIESDFDEITMQSPVEQAIENYESETGVDCQKLYKALDDSKDIIVPYLLNKVDEIARDGNERED